MELISDFGKFSGVWVRWLLFPDRPWTTDLQPLGSQERVAVAAHSGYLARLWEPTLGQILLFQMWHVLHLTSQWCGWCKEGTLGSHSGILQANKLHVSLSACSGCPLRNGLSFSENFIESCGHGQQGWYIWSWDRSNKVLRRGFFLVAFFSYTNFFVWLSANVIYNVCVCACPLCMYIFIGWFFFFYFVA